MAGKKEYEQEPYNRAAAVNLGADTDLSDDPCDAIYVGGGAPGNVKVDLVGGATGILFKLVPVGTTLKLRASKIYSTGNGTTATDLVALYGGGIALPNASGGALKA